VALQNIAASSARRKIETSPHKRWRSLAAAALA
jgi:hypothetical protein